MNRYFPMCLTLFLTFLCFSYALCEDFTLGGITGIIQDQQRRPLEGVQVTITGTEYVNYTDSTGTFFFGEIEPGNYTLSIVMNGYQTQTKTVTVQKGQTRYLVVDMIPGNAGTTNTNSVTTLQTGASANHTLYIANSGIGKSSVMQNQSTTNPYGDNYGGGYEDRINGSLNTGTTTWSSDPYSGVDISGNDPANLIPAYQAGADPVSDAYNPNYVQPPTNTSQQFMGKQSNNLMIMSSGTKQAMSIIEWFTGASPMWVAMNDSGLLFIADSSNVITSINTSGSNQVTGTISMGQNMVTDMAVGNSGTRLFCTLAAAEPSVAVIDCSGGGLVNVKTITLGRMKDGTAAYPWGVGTHKSGHTAYVAMGHQTGGELVAIDTETNSVMYHVTVGQNAFGVAVTPDGRKVYVANQNSANVSVVDTGSKQVIATVPVDYSPVRIAITPDGTKAYVTNKCSGGNGTVSVIDTGTNSVISTIPVGREPAGICVSRDGKMVYVANKGSDSITMIDSSRNTVVGTVPTCQGGMPNSVVAK
ncbi:MAG: carboxypeptidase regulatory-like domain-containing protein [Candidatus Eremiobacterota bacterium]